MSTPTWALTKTTTMPKIRGSTMLIWKPLYSVPYSRRMPNARASNNLGLKARIKAVYALLLFGHQRS